MSEFNRLAGLLLPRFSTCFAAAVLGATITIPVFFASDASAKTPGSTYCYYGTCHRVKTVDEMEALVGQQVVLQTSFYDSCERDKLNPCGLTSSGEVFRPDQADNAASPEYPDGTMLIVRNPETKDTAVVRVNNAGPYWGKRKLDVSRATAEKLGFKKRGVAKLEVRVVKAPQPSETQYRKHRTYDAVPGYIGRFADANSAHAGMTAVMALETAATALLGQVTSGLALALGADPASADPAATQSRVAAADKPRRTKVARSERSTKVQRVASRSSKSYGNRRMASARKAVGTSRHAANRSRSSKTNVASRVTKQKFASASVRSGSPSKSFTAQPKPSKRFAAAERHKPYDHHQGYQRL